MNFFKNFAKDGNNINNEMMLCHWRTSYPYRRAAVREKSYRNVPYMLENWPVIKEDYGHFLVNFISEITCDLGGFSIRF